MGTEVSSLRPHHCVGELSLLGHCDERSDAAFQVSVYSGMQNAADLGDCESHGFLFSSAICRGIRQTRRVRQDSDEDDCTLVGLCAELAAGLAVGVWNCCTRSRVNSRKN